ncbi:MAG: hypothetical protein PUG75_01850 [Prevotella sp.]|nr:hypothetical protein [Prevotella sp.]MDY5259103.1 hypothetical protein [Prevotella sp.]
MKKGYKSPNTVTVNLNLNGSVLDNTVGVVNRSPFGRWEDGAKKNLHNDEPEDETFNNKPNWDD